MTFARHNALKKLLKAADLMTGSPNVRTFFVSARKRISVKELSVKQMDYNTSKETPYLVLIIPAAAFCLGTWQVGLFVSCMLKQFVLFSVVFLVF